jgi:fructan beta-fructosidase
MAKDFRMIFSNEAGDELILEMDAKSQTLIVDRSNSGMVDFQKEFGNKKHVAPIAVLRDDPLDMEIYLDQSSIEVFLNGGLVAMTDQIFPNEPYTILQLENRNDEEKITIMAIEHMASIW